MTSGFVRAAPPFDLIITIGLGVIVGSSPTALACGAYFAKRPPAAAAIASSQLYNRTSKMIVARADNATTITMTADYRGDPQEFAVVIAVPTVLSRDQIKVAD